MLEFDELATSIATRLAVGLGRPADCDGILGGHESDTKDGAELTDETGSAAPRNPAEAEKEPNRTERKRTGKRRTQEKERRENKSGERNPERERGSAKVGTRTVPAAVVVERTTLFTLTSAAITCVMKDFREDGPIVRRWLEELSQEELQVVAAKGSQEVDVYGKPMKLLPSHLELHQQPGQLGWIQVGNGYLACAGAPGQAAFRNWRREAATSVVSLLRADEPAFLNARDGCTKCGFRWEHAPLSGKRACTTLESDPHDLCSWHLIRDLLPRLFADGERVVIHCAAGMHRTGSVAFCALRHSGFSSEESLKAIEACRPVTHGALLEEQRGRPKLALWEIVEAARASRSPS